MTLTFFWLILQHVYPKDYLKKSLFHSKVTPWCWFVLSSFLRYDIRVYQLKGFIMLAIRLPNDIETRLSDLAFKTGRTKTFYAREAILTHLEDLEDYYLAAQVVSDINKGDVKTHHSSDVRADLGLED